MKIISEANEAVLSILKQFLNTTDCVRWIQYSVQTPVDEGVLVLNLLTRELLLLTQEEYDSFNEIDYLKQRWFVVPESMKEKECADLVKWVLSARRPKPKEITGYTIFTTTDCNARCFYCFELGASRIPMSCETAKKTVRYIKDHCGGKSVQITWFGGEPLFNMPAIETISTGLRSENISFSSAMVSNGYLFDDLAVQKAVNDWNLKQVQITLDGTEKIYNKIKAYIYQDCSPYEIVLCNIGRLLDAGIRVTVRLNMDIYNADDLLSLVQELADRFRGKNGLRVYAHHLFKNDVSMAEMHTDDEWEKRDAAMLRLTDCIDRNGLSSVGGISKQIRLTHCKADSGSAVTILPDGNIGLCEHFTDSEFIGHLDHEGYDTAIVARWKEKTPEISECTSCFYFLDCMKLKKCANSTGCYRQYRQEKLRNVQRAMVNEHQKRQNNSVFDENENDGTC